MALEKSALLWLNDMGYSLMAISKVRKTDMWNSILDVVKKYRRGFISETDCNNALKYCMTH